MDQTTQTAFFNELEKIAAKKTEKVEKDDAGSPARHANNIFGLPHSDEGLVKGINGLRRYDRGSDSKAQPQQMQGLDGKSQAELSQSGVVNPSSGPAGP